MKKGEKGKVFVGLSGGVDSAVSAALLQEQGYDVTGLFVRIAVPEYPCEVVDDRRSALRVATHLRIPFHEVDLSEAYRQKVFDEMLAGYQRGETPNPDTLCNREIKFGLMYDYAREHGADFLATGHYARTATAKDGDTHLMTSVDNEKDQSYFLWMVPEHALAHVLFPVGGMKKTQVRALAKKFGLPNAERKDSQGICFLGRLSMEELLARELHPQEGKVVDERGEVIGTHRGAILYTLGQRHGFSVPAHSPHEMPLEVIAKDISANTITVAPQIENTAKDSGAEASTTVRLHDVNWIGNVVDDAYLARFRYRQALIPAQLARDDGSTTVVLEGAHHLPVGQSLVLYKGERCLGGGIIQ